MEPDQGAVYHAAHSFTNHVQKELGIQARRYGPLFYSPRFSGPSAWASNRWKPLYTIRYSSPKDAQEQLLTLSAGPWSPVFWTLHDQGNAIARGLKLANTKVRTFPFSLPSPGPGAFTILQDGVILASPTTESPFPGGIATIKENKVDPPSSAYAKLQEALVRLNWFPGTQSRCMDAGACPGGWTWVLAQSGASVLAIDRAPLDPRVGNLANVHYKKGNAFSDHSWKDAPFDIICSDVICYPQALWDWFIELFEHQASARWVLSIKMQGNPDWDIIRRFQAIPGGQVYHGTFNKHEVTFIYPSPSQHGIFEE